MVDVAQLRKRFADVFDRRVTVDGELSCDRHVGGCADELLGISRAFAYELVARGVLPVVRLSRRRLVPKRAHHALVELEPEPTESLEHVLA